MASCNVAPVPIQGHPNPGDTMTNETTPALPAVGAIVMERESTFRDGAVVHEDHPYTVTHAEPRMVLGKRDGRGKTVLLLRASGMGA